MLLRKQRRRNKAKRVELDGVSGSRNEMEQPEQQHEMGKSAKEEDPMVHEIDGTSPAVELGDHPR